MTHVINIRGTNGSGKTHVVRQWMAKVGAEPQPRWKNLFGGTTLSGRIEYYKLGDGGIVMGTYENNCGGADNYKDFDSLARAITARLAENPPYLIFEGVIVSHIYGYWLQYSLRFGGMTWVFLDTPVDECLRRIYARNSAKAINEDYVKEKHRAIENIRIKALKDDQRVVVLHWQHACAEFERLIYEPPPVGRSAVYWKR